jgi:zinc transport system substrate-binding protein
MRKITLFLMAFLALSPPALAEPPRVVASIAPLAGIAAAVMDGVGTPELLVGGNASPHTYQLKPSDAQRLAQADVVFWVGPEFETFLARALGSHAAYTPASPLPAQREKLALALMGGDPDLQSPERTITYQLARSGPLWNGEGADGHDHHGHHHQHDHADSFYDPHLWLDPYNTVAAARLLAETLATQDPHNAQRYKNNAHAFAQKLAGLDADINTRLTPLRTRGFVVFHDAYQYFERRYKLKGLGAIHVSPDVPPSARLLTVLRKRLEEQQAVCVLAEPQFKDAVVDTLIEGTGARKGLVNPDASDLPIGPDMYIQYLLRLTAAFEDCLKPADGASSP